MTDSRFDVVVVGAGTAGCVIAGRLAQVPGLRVLLLEAGASDGEPWLRVPGGYYRTLQCTATDWGYIGAPEDGLNGRCIRHPRGKVLGGCSSTNGLVYIRGAATDYDAWASALADPAWSYRQLLPLFRRSECNRDLRGEYHGQNGPMRVARPAYRSALTDAFIGAAATTGVPITDDFNGETMDGVGYYQLTADECRRSSATAFVAQAGPGLDVRLRQEVLRVVVEGGRAIGIDVAAARGDVERIYGDAIVLSAGAFGTPYLLQRSGIGPTALLRGLGVPVALENDDVGQGLQDHLQARVVFETDECDSLNAFQRALLRNAEFPADAGPALSVGAGVVGMFSRSRDGLPAPDIQFHLIPFSAELPGKLHDRGGVTVSICALRPQSRGSVAVTSLDPAVAPRIDCGYLREAGDIAPIREGLRILHRLSQHLEPRLRSCLSPIALDDSDAALDDYIRTTATTIFHPVGTCAMGQSGGVVDSRLRAKGMDRLWIADASIMPAIVSGNTHAASVMIGERAADELAHSLGLLTPWATG